MVRGDVALIWREAESFKKDFRDNKNLFGNGIEYTRTFLPSKIVAIYSSLFNKKLYEDSKNEIIQENGKLIYLSLQIILYYLSLLFLYKKLFLFYEDKNISFFVVSYLALDPNIIQWHGTLWTESIFVSLQVFLIGMIIKKINQIYFVCF